MFIKDSEYTEYHVYTMCISYYDILCYSMYTYTYVLQVSQNLRKKRAEGSRDDAS